MDTIKQAILRHAKQGSDRPISLSPAAFANEFGIGRKNVEEELIRLHVREDIRLCTYSPDEKALIEFSQYDSPGEFFSVDPYCRVAITGTPAAAFQY